MTPPLEKIGHLLALADQDNEEGRTAAHLAIKLMKQHGFVVTMAAREEPAPRPAPPPAPRSRRWDRDPPAPRPAPSPPPTRQPVHQPKAPGRFERAMAIVVDETEKFFQTIDVLPRDIPISGVQLVPAIEQGFCGRCGARFRRGELVSRQRPHVCAPCVAKQRRLSQVELACPGCL